jgi:hypothetical protein
LVAQNKELPRRCVSRETSRAGDVIVIFIVSVGVLMSHSSQRAHTALGLMSPALQVLAHGRGVRAEPYKPCPTAPTHTLSRASDASSLCAARHFTFAILISARTHFSCALRNLWTRRHSSGKTPFRFSEHSGECMHANEAFHRSIFPGFQRY